MSSLSKTPMTSADQRRGMRLVYIGQAVGAIQTQILLGSAIGVLLIKHLGGTDFQATLIVPLMLAARALQIPISLTVPPSRGKRFMLRGWLGCGLAMAAAIGVTFLPLDPQPKVMTVLTLFAIAGVMQVSALTFWFPLLHDVIPEQMRGRFFGRMRTIWNTTSFIAIVLAGKFLGDAPELWRFQVILIFALGLFLLRNVFIAQLPETDQHADDNYSDWKQYIRHILTRREVLVFCVYFSLLSFAAGFLGPPLVLYMNHLGFRAEENVITFSCAPLGQMIALLPAGWLADHIGTKRVFLVAHLGMCLVFVAVIAIGELPTSQAMILMPLAVIATGAMLATANVACTAQLFHLAPDHGRAFFMSLAMIVMAYGASVSPALAGAANDYAAHWLTVTVAGIEFHPLQVIFAAAAAGMLLLLVFLAFMEDVRNPRP